MPDSSQIYYTRLKADANGKISNYMTKMTWSTGTPCYYGPAGTQDSTMVAISRQPGQDTISKLNGYPVVYRDVEEWRDTINTPGSAGDSCLVIDRIFWSGFDKYYWENYKKVIFTKYFHFIDIARPWGYDPWGYWRSNIYWYMSQNLELYQPNAVQGYIRPYRNLNTADTSWYFEHDNDSISVVNFAGYVSPGNNSSAKVWHVLQGYWNMFNIDTLENYVYAKRIDGNGYIPQLAALPYIKWGNEWNLNRRIFNTGSAAPPKIVSNLLYYYKRGDDKKDHPYSFMGFAYNNKRNLLSHIYLTDNYGNVHIPKFNIWNKQGLGYILRDTIYTDWFNVKDVSKMNFYNFGTPSLNIITKIERQNDRKQFNLPVSYFPDRKFTKNNISLLNGGNNKYRIVLEKLEPYAVYTESIVIDGLPDLLEMNAGIDNKRFGKEALIDNDAIIDLGEKSYDSDVSEGIRIDVYPNPVDDILYITAFLPNRFYLNQAEATEQNLDIRIYSNIGETLFEAEAKPGEIVMVTTKNYYNGAYFIRAEQKSSSKTLPAAVKSFIVGR